MNRFVAVALLALTTSAAFCASDYKAGSGESVKGWGARDFEQFQTLTNKPLLVYIADEAPKNNPFAKVLENDVLGGAEIKDKLKNYVTLRLASDGKKGKGWPPDIIKRGSKGAAILLISSDLRNSLWIDKNTPKDQLNAKHLLQQMQLMDKYQVTLKPALEAAAKKAEDDRIKREAKELAAKPPEDKSKDLLEGFLGDKDKDKIALDGKKDAAPIKKEEPKKKAAEPIDE